MPMLKIGKTYYNDEERPLYLVQGNAIRDGEDAPVKGRDHAKVSVAAAQGPDGSSIFVTVNGWRGRAGDVAAVRKQDSVLAIGVLKKREYDGRYYYDLDADFITVSGVGGPYRRSDAPHVAAALDLEDPLSGLEEVSEDDGVLPF